LSSGPRPRLSVAPLARLAGLVGYRRSTIWKVLRRHGCSQQRRSPKKKFTRRYEWSEPDVLLRMDITPLRSSPSPAIGFDAITRCARSPAKVSRWIEFAYVNGDSRLAHVEIHPF
jgi:hypothetical protein